MMNLVGKEMSFVELDNEMMANGYYSVFDEGATADIKDCKNVVYTNASTGECEKIIEFEIINDNGEDEIEEAFTLKVTSVRDF